MSYVFVSLSDAKVYPLKPRSFLSEHTPCRAICQNPAFILEESVNCFNALNLASMICLIKLIPFIIYILGNKSLMVISNNDFFNKVGCDQNWTTRSSSWIRFSFTFNKPVRIRYCSRPKGIPNSVVYYLFKRNISKGTLGAIGKVCIGAHSLRDSRINLIYQPLQIPVIGTISYWHRKRRVIIIYWSLFRFWVLGTLCWQIMFKPIIYMSVDLMNIFSAYCF